MSEIFRPHGGAAPSHEDVAATGTLVADAEEFRLYKKFTNISDTAIYLALHDTGSNSARPENGIYLEANGGSYEITLLNMYRGRIWAITPEGTVGTKRLAIQSG